MSATCSDNRTNVIRYECGLVKAELEPDSEGVLENKKDNRALTHKETGKKLEDIRRYKGVNPRKKGQERTLEKK